MEQERDFWVVLLIASDTERAEETSGGGSPLDVNLRLLSWEGGFEANQGLAVFTTEDRALAYGWHVEDQEVGNWRILKPLRLTQAQIRELIFEGDPHGVCAVDPSLDGEGLVIGVNGLHLV